MVSALFSPIIACASLLDAFVLAVDHFDPDHELGLELDSPEVQYLLQALEAAREAIPEVTGIHVRTDQARGDRLSPRMFTALEFVDRNEPSGDYTLTPEIESALASKIGAKRRVEIETNERIGLNRIPNVRKSTLYTFDNYCGEGADIELCGNEEIVRWLCSSGVGEVLLIENSYKGRNRARFYLLFRQVVDLQFKSKLFMADPFYDDLFGDHVLKPFSGDLFGDGNSVEIVDALGYEGFDGVVIEFKIGWGDCPAGCIYSHYWKVFIRVEGESDGQDWRFVIADVEEGGTPIHEGARARLRGSVTR